MLPGVAQFFSMKPKASPTPSLPYDAEVEWLESTGTQWIDTGITAALNLLVEFSFAIVEYETDPSSGANHIFGDANATRSGFYFSPSTVTNKYTCCVLSTPNATYDEGVTAQIDTAWHYVMADSTRSAGSVRLDGIYLKSNVASTDAHNPPHTFYLFALHNSSGGVTIGAASRRRIASFKVTDTATNQVIQDLIPVRKDGVGYMYDKVTGTLLANQGTGAFLYGKDKNPLYAAEVDYIESTGTQWIDTGLSPVKDTLTKCRFKIVEMASSTYTYCPFGYLFVRGTCFGCFASTLGVFRGGIISGIQSFSVSNDTEWHDVALNTSRPRQAWLDGIKRFELDSESTIDSQQDHKINLFTYITNNGDVRAANCSKGRIASYSVTNTITNQVIQDLVPVRVLRNGKFVGAMYDRVTDTVLENAGTGDLLVGRDKEYDYEVEYIERDFTKPWMVNGSEAKNIGFDISEYMPEDNHVNTFPKMAATYSFSPQPAGLQTAISFGSIALNTLVVYYSIAKLLNDIYYRISFGTASGSYYQSSFEGSLGEFHTAEIVPDGTGNATAYINGTSLGSGSMSTITVKNFFVLAGRGMSSSDQCQMRVKNARFGSTVYLIPVVKGDAVGFYNIVDGHLFLEEQACLSAGPKV